MPGWTLLTNIESFRQNSLSYFDISIPLLDVWKQCKLMVRTKTGDFVCRSSRCGCMTLSFCKIAVLIPPFLQVFKVHSKNVNSKIQKKMVAGIKHAVFSSFETAELKSVVF